ncbi:hypothetical protein C2S53_004316 [Perilla frutescens var. hirtella]|uniref:F-box domain-containing protein n=1 Tax=Perilla frutescens var. hirtella TaxID=608512 RepID=A0AAD4INZ9_PERFH|nr:hypothetical protein C2S53_004316 [Perilla frutescens var. hirtella]
MKKSKSSVREPTRDRLSELPDSLILKILGLLPMKDFVRTSILSKRWENLWATIPCLNFDYLTREISPERVRNIVNGVLRFWRGTKIVKFKIHLSSEIVESLVSDIDVWLRFAKENEVEVLCVDLMNSDGIYCVPQFLFSSCPSLKVLVLRGCSLCVPENVQWNNLRSLTIDGYRLTPHLMAKVLSGSPQLEVFILHVMESGENLRIQSSSLKMLCIEKFVYGDDGESSMDKGYAGDGPSMNTELAICTPNLGTLELSGISYSKCSLLNVSSLTHATIGFYGDDLFTGTDVHEETLRQIFPTIQHVESVTLSDCCIKVLGAMEKKHLLSPLPNVKFLKLNGILSEGEEIAGLLEIFPELKMLVIEDEDDERCEYHHRESLVFERNLPKSFLLQLRTVEVTWCWHEGDNSIFPFIQFLLKYASKLEKMVFRLKGIMPPEQQPEYWFWGSQKVLKMPKSSRTADIIFREY